MKKLLIVMLLFVVALIPADSYAQVDVVQVQVNPGKRARVDGPPLTVPGPRKQESSTSYRPRWSWLIDELTLGAGQPSFKLHRRL